MERVGAIPDREQIAQEVKSVIEEMYRNRYRQTEGQAFGAIKKATDHALEDLGRRGFPGIANRLTTEIAHVYMIKHRYEHIPALKAFADAAQEVLESFANGEIV